MNRYTKTGILRPEETTELELWKLLNGREKNCHLYTNNRKQHILKDMREQDWKNFITDLIEDPALGMQTTYSRKYAGEKLASVHAHARTLPEFAANATCFMRQLGLDLANCKSWSLPASMLDETERARREREYKNQEGIARGLEVKSKPRVSNEPPYMDPKVLDVIKDFTPDQLVAGYKKVRQPIQDMIYNWYLYQMANGTDEAKAKAAAHVAQLTSLR